jgi:hypothetical protein
VRPDEVFDEAADVTTPDLLVETIVNGFVNGDGQFAPHRRLQR